MLIPIFILRVIPAHRSPVSPPYSFLPPKTLYSHVAISSLHSPYSTRIALAAMSKHLSSIVRHTTSRPLAPRDTHVVAHALTTRVIQDVTSDAINRVSKAILDLSDVGYLEVTPDGATLHTTVVRVTRQHDLRVSSETTRPLLHRFFLRWRCPAAVGTRKDLRTCEWHTLRRRWGNPDIRGLAASDWMGQRRANQIAFGTSGD